MMGKFLGIAGCLVVLFGTPSNAQNEAQKKLGRAVAGQQCLAPLVWEARKGTRPLAFEEAFYDGPFHAPLWDDDLTPIAFSVSTKKADAQLWFDRGIHFLHGLDEAKAEAAFRQSISLDPDLAMGYWGLALANLDNRRRATTFIAKAQNAINDESAMERQFITTWDTFIRESEGTASDRLKLVAALESAYLASATELTSGPLFEENLQTGAFLLRQILLNEVRGGIPIQNRTTVDAFIRELEAKSPRYPLEIYRALLWRNQHQDQFFQSLNTSMTSDEAFDLVETPDTLSLMASLSRNSRHWRGAADILTDSIHLDLDQIIAEEEMPDGGQNLGSNAASLIRNLVGRGQTSAAISLAKAFTALPTNPYAAETIYRRVSRDERLWSATRDAWMEALVQSGRWDEVAALPEGFEPADRARYFSWCAIAAKQMKDETKALRYLAQARRATKQPDPVVGFAEAYFDWVAGENFETLPRIPGIPLHHLASLVLQHGKPELAVQILRLEPQSEFIHEVLQIETHLALGNKKEALRAIDDQFRVAAAPVENDNPLRGRLAKISESLGVKIPIDPVSREPAQFDFANHASPDLALPNHTSKVISLEQYRGKPVVVIFFLGGSCLHCVQQLTAFIPWVDRYRAAGIDIVTVSTDEVSHLNETLSLEAEAGNDAIPFEILSDAELDAFKRFGVYDRFEQRAMHGTFLIDPEGEVAWKELGHEPFMRADFLLHEAQRLMK